MKFEVTLPSLGDDANDVAELAVWCAKIGDTIDEGEDLLEVTTDKAAFTLPSPKAGTVVEVRKAEGDPVHTGEVVCILDI